MYQQDDFLIRPSGSLLRRQRGASATSTPCTLRRSTKRSTGEHDFRLIDVPADQVDKRAPVIMLR